MQSNRKYYVKYALRFTGWTALLLLITELFIRFAIVSTPPFSSKVNGGGVEIYGIEGYGLVYYLPNMEIATPYSGGDNIVTMGDSFTQARQILFWNNYSSVAEKELRSSGYSLDVRNFGYMASALPYYIGIGDGLIKTYHPRLVVIQLALNDFTGPRVFDRTVPFYFVKKSGQLIFTDQSKKDNRWGKLPERITSNPGFSFYFRSSIETLLDIRKGQNTVAPDEAPRSAGATNSASTPAAANKSDDINKISMESTYSQELSFLEAAYGDIPIIFILRPDFSDKQQAFSYGKNLDLLVSLIEQRPSWSVIYLDSAFNKSFKKGISPIGFGNTDPFSGHWNNRGHEIVGTLLAERIAEILGK